LISSAILPVLGATSAQNVELREHLKVFTGANLRVRALLDAVVKDPDQEGVYMGEIREESEALALRALVLPRSVPSSLVVKKLEESLGQFGEGGEVRGLKRPGVGVGEGSEERRKRARNV
jgi:hypothetical protein